MHLTFRGVNEAFRGLVKVFRDGEYNLLAPELLGPKVDYCFNVPISRKPSRVGEVLQIEEPVTITYERPTERVLFNAARDANPFFHLYEAMWMLAGRNDLAPLQYYVKTFDTFSDDGKTLNGAYGYRWRHTSSHVFDDTIDQLDVLVDHLRVMPQSRRAVLQMWSPDDDLIRAGGPCPACDGTGTESNSPEGECGGCDGNKIDPGSKDVCCNLSAMFSIREETYSEMDPRRFKTLDEARQASVDKYGSSDYARPTESPCVYRQGLTRKVLDMTVTNRSNDTIWGTLGANIVHFSFLLEYMAARIGVCVGKYNQFTNNLHCYTSRFEPDKWLADPLPNFYESGAPRMKTGEPYNHSWCYMWDKIVHVPLVKDVAAFEEEVRRFVDNNDGRERKFKVRYTEPFLDRVAQPMMDAHYEYKHGNAQVALALAYEIQAADWRIAATQWIERRMARVSAGSNKA